MRWTLLCRVVDNFGDIGFAWRLAADLAGRGEQVRLAVDDASALAWMAPGGAAGIEVVAWEAATAAGCDVLVETFGCGWPEAVAAELVARAARPVCVNVEHLSAEPFVERSHGLPSPRFTVGGEPLPTWYFYPGFGDGTGGLLREPSLLQRRAAFGDGRAWLAGLGIERRRDERCVSLFCYPNPAADGLLDALSIEPTLLLLTPGSATRQALELLGPGLRRGSLRALPLPALSQVDFDHLLWSCDLNVVRGEDSLVRAVWAGAPFLWQAYVQDDAAHAAKVDAFLDRFLAGASTGLAAAVRRLFSTWNGLAGAVAAPDLGAIDRAEWAAHSLRWRDGLAAQPDLTSALLGFVASKR
ncbi:MAG: elongation factor P maturation arginine rhamnosyltransferase EarP [Burkholderiales bacterium]|nr:elongation factor P maturation arginine rhamnosyltransferase EarP [Burkholderiales bacterium]